MADEQENGTTVGSGVAADDVLLAPDALRRVKIFRAGSELLRDPFSDATHERQKLLLGLALLTLGVSRCLFVIKKVSIEDVEVEIAIAHLSYVLAALTIYITALFGVGAWQEWKRAKDELDAGLQTLSLYFYEAIQNPARQAEQLRKLLDSNAPFKQEWEAATAAYEKVRDSVAVTHQRNNERLAIAHDQHDRKAQGLSGEAENREAERYSDEVMAIAAADERASARFAAASARLDRRREQLKEKYGLDTYNKALGELTRAATKPNNAVTDAAKAASIAKTTQRHLEIRRWLEVWLPLALGAVAIVLGFLPAKPH